MTATHETHAENARPSVKRRPGRTSRTQLKLFESAMVIMSEKGPTATTVDEIAAKAGVSKGTVYYNFGSKKSMVDGLLRYGVKLVLESIDDAVDEVDDPRERLTRATIAALRFLETQPGFARLAIAEMWRPHGQASSPVLSEQRGVIINRVAELVDDLSEKYEVSPTPDSASVAVAIFGATFMLAMDREMNHSTRTTQDATRAVSKLVDGYILGPLE